jgi:hypothetical protein
MANVINNEYIICKSCRHKYVNTEEDIKKDFGYNKLDVRFKTCSKCRVVNREQSKQYYSKNREVVSEKCKLYREANKEAIKERKTKKKL